MKRLFDIVASAAGITVAGPLMLFATILIKLEGGGPVLFRQRRVGKDLRPFEILKFRTMVVDAPRMGPGITIGQDRRVTRVGAFLRRTKLDELPQLFNVLRGDMSFVGPRPELPRYVDLYLREYREILAMRPGITSLASLTYRNESDVLGRVPDPEEYYARALLPEKLRLDREYVRRASLGFDLRLIAVTVMCLLYPKRHVDRMFERIGRFRFPVTLVVHAAAIAAASIGALWLRFDGVIPAPDRARLIAAFPALLILRLLALQAFGLHRRVWRHAGLRDLARIAAAVAISSAAFAAILPWLPGSAGYSRGTIVIDALLVLVLLGGLRFARRIQDGIRTEFSLGRKAVLVGPSDAVERVLRQIVHAPRSEFRVVGLLERDPCRRGATVHGVPVLGTPEDLEAVVRRLDPDEILVAGTADPGARLLAGRAARLEKPVRAIPDPLAVLMGDPGAAGRLYEPEDLLFREPVRAEAAELERFYAGRSILVTGAGGSIGSEICRQACALAPRRVVLFEKHEASLFHIDRELRAAWPDLEIVPVIGDVADVRRVTEVLAATRPEVVFHAAAYKHVPMMEHNPSEAYKTNVLGTRAVAEVARNCGAGVFVLISTDKAVEPLSTMGLTKRIAELTVQRMNGSGETRFMAVRFGNVLGSSGSVVPVFREQIERGGPITVTHAEVTRLFMSVPEAVQLILQAGTMGKGGEVFVLDMGKPIRILDMAKALARLHGLDPDRDIDIVFTGLRPGERLFEKLFNDHEKVWKTGHPKILMAANGGAGEGGGGELRDLLSMLEQRIHSAPVLPDDTQEGAHLPRPS